MNEISYLVYDDAGEYLGMSPLREQAVGAARTAARRGGNFADVVRVAVTKSGTTTRRCRYHADGTVEQLWKTKGNRATVAVRPHKLGDTGIITMPMKKNVPEGGPAWRLVTCPVCGRECWETPEKVVAMQLEPQLRAACTECALAAVLTRKEVSGTVSEYTCGKPEYAMYQDGDYCPMETGEVEGCADCCYGVEKTKEEAGE